MAWNVCIHPLSPTVVGLEDDRAAPAGQFGVAHEGLTLRFRLTSGDLSDELSAVWYSAIEVVEPAALLTDVLGDHDATAFLARLDELTARAVGGTGTEPGDYDPAQRGARTPLISGDEADVPRRLPVQAERVLQEAVSARLLLLSRFALDPERLPDWVAGEPAELFGDEPFAIPRDGASSLQPFWWPGLSDEVVASSAPPIFVLERSGDLLRVEAPRLRADLEPGLMLRVLDESAGPTERPTEATRSGLEAGVAEVAVPAGEGPFRTEIVDLSFRPVLSPSAFRADMARQAGVVAVAATMAGLDGAVIGWWWRAAEHLYRAAPGHDLEADAAADLAATAAPGAG